MARAVVVKRYKTERQYRHDASRMAKHGYKVASMTSERPNPGCIAILTFGLYSLFFQRPQYIVTYQLA